MSFVSEEVAQKHLDAWLDAELKVSEGQSYSVGSRSLTRANLNEITEKINYWRSVLNQIKNKKRGRSSRGRIMGVVPRDL